MREGAIWNPAFGRNGNCSKAGFRTKGSSLAEAKHALFRNDGRWELCESDSSACGEDGDPGLDPGERY